MALDEWQQTVATREELIEAIHRLRDREEKREDRLRKWAEESLRPGLLGEFLDLLDEAGGDGA